MDFQGTSLVMKRYFWPVVVCWAGKVLSMCSIKRYPPSVEEWYGCVPCPPPRNFSLLCSHVCKDCELLSKLLEVCLSQYNMDYQKWFTEDIKCLEKQACLDKHPLCVLDSVFKVMNVSCRQTTDRIITTPYLTTPTPSTTQGRITQTTKSRVITDLTTKSHVITDVTNFTTLWSFPATDNDSTLTSVNTSIPMRPSRIENDSPNAAYAIIIVITVLISLFFIAIAIKFVARRAKENYSISVRAPLERQTSTSSRAPIIRTDDGYTILCLTFKRRTISQERGHLPLKETPRGYYNSVPLGETEEYQMCHTKDGSNEEKTEMNCNEVVSSVEDDVINTDGQESGV